MEYTIQKLAHLSGVSTRTLRYYDEIGLLKPARVNSSGYRIYGTVQVDLLQHILFYRELGLSLEDIKKTLHSPEFNGQQVLHLHHVKLLEKRIQLDRLIDNVEKTLAHLKGERDMTDKEKFEGFKQKLIDDNERQYGDEIRQKYGNDAVERSNQKVKGMTKQEYDEVTALNEKLLLTLQEAFRTGDPAGELAQEAVNLHKQWLTFYRDNYSKEMHAGLGQMYVDDPRFTAYYDQYQPGLAIFLRDAILVYTGVKS
ncbi:MerR family transcriptional regulator [Clostridium aminobutyricum]|uniref:MerR family transcriptional regulator n=1 Tax=Clostridium aminobutyricum TaxID=33953 RepID=A0A939D6T9_CLOAM|nr:MerR family transcriptional regulator [Clostridium aminobutyricum]MBN7771798.1 MerR family transcriptional regulator [Clostridium aminobutyricum]